jgi:hypothetical protein
MGRGQLGAERWGAAESWVGQGGDVMLGSARRGGRAAAAAAQQRGAAWFGKDRGRLGGAQLQSRNICNPVCRYVQVFLGTYLQHTY